MSATSAYGNTQPDPAGAALSGAAQAYAPGDAAAALDLVAAASEIAAPTNVVAVPIDETMEGTSVAEGDEPAVVVDGNGPVTVVSPDGIEIGLGSAGGDTSVVEGAIIATDAAPSTDLVTRATESGVQMTAVLADQGAPTDVAFNLDLPQGAELSVRADGSVAVTAPVEISTVDDRELAETTEAISAILGNVTDPDAISAEQWAQIEAVPAVTETTTVSQQQIATIEQPWAVDANGTVLPTHYELTEGGIKQVVETDESTVFPVVADPNWVWWTWTALTCAAQVATFAFGVAKLAYAITKIKGLVSKSSSLAKVVKKIGGPKGLLESIHKAAKGFVEGKVGKYLNSTQRLALSALTSTGLNMLGDALGIGSCVSLIREMF